jgi:hypothetical protein
MVGEKIIETDEKQLLTIYLEFIRIFYLEIKSIIEINPIPL